MPYQDLQIDWLKCFVAVVDAGSLEQLQSHLNDYLWAYDSARLLRALKGKTPIGFILGQWQKEPQRFYDNLDHFFTGPNT